MRTVNQLLEEAIEVFEEEREVTFKSNEVDGVVTDPDAIEIIDRYDRWLAEARASLG